MKIEQLKNIVVPLLDWYHNNSRKLPWRESKDPYRIWVSEIMLQQTRVEAVLSYYERFMEHFPTVESLAACDDEVLFKLWEGLGYYTRVRNLKKAAQIICTHFQGQFPRQFDQILALPGIGAYTAGAIASIAFEQAKAAVDGNVLRVITRLTQDNHDITDAKFRNKITEALEERYPKKHRGDFTQSLMELGAVVCVPNGVPQCSSCPINQFCDAYTNKTQLLYPVRKRKAARKVEKKTIFILCFEEKIALRKREADGVLSGMWELPNQGGTLTRQQVCQWLAERGLMADTIEEPSNKKKQLKHIFTHIEWHMTYWVIVCNTTGIDQNFVWVTNEQLEQDLALPTAFKKVYQAALRENFVCKRI